jgi:spore germination protein GerM
MKKKKRAASPTLGCLFWVALVVVLVAVALAVREPVVRNVRKLLGRPEAGTSTGEPARSAEGDAPATGRPAPAQPAATRPAGSTPKPASPAATQPAPEASKSPTPAAGTPASVSSAATASAKPARTRAARLWFTRVDEEGAIELAPADRTLPVGDAPLRDTLAALLAGPTAVERGAGLVSFVPSGTVVRSVVVTGDTAVIDFSEQFRFNALGIEGLRAQLRQVVWAATEFPTVARVQVLIEGRRVDYLGPEGAAVGSPLGRDSAFQ